MYNRLKVHENCCTRYDKQAVKVSHCEGMPLSSTADYENVNMYSL